MKSRLIATARPSPAELKRVAQSLDALRVDILTFWLGGLLSVREATPATLSIQSSAVPLGRNASDRKKYTKPITML